MIPKDFGNPIEWHAADQVMDVVGADVRREPTQDGRKVQGSIDHPKGHVKNPVTDADLEKKLIGLNNGLLSPKQVSHLAELCWRLDELDDVREIVTATRI